MELQQDVRRFSGQLIAVAFALLALAALVLGLAAWQLAAGAGPTPVSHSSPVQVTSGLPQSQAPDAQDRNQQLGQSTESRDRVPTQGPP